MKFIPLQSRAAYLMSLPIDAPVEGDTGVVLGDERSGATLSMDRKYRYRLWRTWDPTRPLVAWIMLNPSTADHETNDPTIKKCIKFSQRWGFGGLEVVNLFPYRATNPAELKKLSYFEALGPANAERFIWDAAGRAAQTIAAWGQHGRLHGQDYQVTLEALSRGIKLHALKLAKNDTPYHPLYLRDDTQPFLWRE